MIECWFDGACWPNPGGPAAAGAIIRDGDEILFYDCEFLPAGDTTNNVAEYAGLILILNYLLDNSIKDPVVIYGDSQLVIKQMSGEWNINEPSLNKPRLYYSYAKESLRLKFGLNVAFQWIPRAQNSEADALSNMPLIERGIRNPYDK